MMQSTRKLLALGAQEQAQIVSHAAATARAMLAKRGRPSAAVRSLPRARAAGSAPFKHAALHLTELRAVRKTRELKEGKDEMQICGIAIAADLTTAVIGPFDAGGFGRDGDARAFDPAAELVTLGLGATFPQTVGAVLCAIENDGNNGAAAIAELLVTSVDALKQELQASAALRAAEPAPAPEAEKSGLAKFFELVRQVVNVLAETGILDAIRKVDEVFTDDRILGTLASATAPFPGGALGPVETVTFDHKGVVFNSQYTAKLRWVATA
jgi:hypothetical protein